MQELIYEGPHYSAFQSTKVWTISTSWESEAEEPQLDRALISYTVKLPPKLRHLDLHPLNLFDSKLVNQFPDILVRIQSVTMKLASRV